MVKNTPSLVSGSIVLNSPIQNERNPNYLNYTHIPHSIRIIHAKCNLLVNPVQLLENTTSPVPKTIVAKVATILIHIVILPPSVPH